MPVESIRSPRPSDLGLDVPEHEPLNLPLKLGDLLPESGPLVVLVASPSSPMSTFS